MVSPGSRAPELILPTISGETYHLSGSQPDRFTVIIFYRGSHCPLCLDHLKEIEQYYQKAKDAGIEIVAVSMDSKDKAVAFAEKVVENDAEKDSVSFPIAYGLTEKEARQWGLFLSAKREGSNEPNVFSEPGLFVIRPNDKSIFMMEVQSAPFTRPSMEQLIGGLVYAHDNKYPLRGNLKVEDKVKTNQHAQ